MFIFKNEIYEERSDDLRYPPKRSISSEKDFTKTIIADLSNRRTLRKKKVKNNG